MTTKAEETGGSTAFDTVKLLLALAVLVAGIVCYYTLEQQLESVLARAGIMLGAVVVSILLALSSAQGKVIWSYIQGSRTEVRKVVWPTRQETVQTTLIVVLVVVLLGLFLWLVDSALLFLIGLLPLS